MPAKTTVRVAMTNNAAKDDYYSNLDWMAEDHELAGLLNVLGNDPGSAKLIGVSQNPPTGTSDMVNGGSTFVPTGFTGSLSVSISGGQLAIDATGLNGDLQSLGEGDTTSITFYYTAQMANGVYSTAKVTIDIQGENDVANITGDNEGDVHEDGALSAGGTLTPNDVDNGENVFQAVAAEDLEGDYGVFTFDAETGQWTYDLDNDAVQGFGADDTATETLTVTSLDGTDSETITVTIHGTNDVATISGDNEDDVYEDGDLAASGTLSVSDVDDGEDVFDDVAAGDLDGDYGAFTFDSETGEWSYALDNDAAQSLGGGETATETLTVSSLDGTDSETITVTVHGENDAAEIGGADSGAVTEDDAEDEVSGALTIDDVDGEDEESFNAQTIGGVYGSLSIDADGNWTYTLDNDDPDTDALNDGDAEDEVFTVTSADGTEHEITVTVNGNTDAPPFTPPPVFTGTGDPNDFDHLGAATGDNLSGAAGNTNDTLYGGAGNDTINGGGGNDSLYGGSGNDQVNGNNDVDTLYGGSGNDTVSGGNSNDTIVGGYGADTLTGNNGADTFVYLSNLDTGDTITDFAAGDKINLAAFAPTAFVGLLAAPGAVGPNQAGYTNDGTTTTIYVDTDGVAGTDLVIYLSNNYIPSAADFIMS